jgi:Co/Zn/Cd efflux system component
MHKEIFTMNNKNDSIPESDLYLNTNKDERERQKNQRKSEDNINTINNNITQNTTLLGFNSGNSFLEEKGFEEEKERRKNKKIIDYESNKFSIISIERNFDDIINSIIRLYKSNKDFKCLLIFFIFWLIFIISEFTHAYAESLSNVLSDSFFNIIKLFSFLVSAMAIYANRYFNYRIKMLYERIELIAAFINLIFLIIISFIMFISSFHLITKNSDSENLHSSNVIGNNNEIMTINTFKFFFLIKLFINLACLNCFSDYVLHPILQIKIYVMKKYGKWLKTFNDISDSELQETQHFIKIWNNHFDNINCLLANVITDMISSLLFLIGFFISDDNHFEYIYFFTSCINLFIVFIFVYLLSENIVNILMQGRSTLTENIEIIIHKEICLFEGCLGIKDMKFWMTSNNKASCKI